MCLSDRAIQSVLLDDQLSVQYDIDMHENKGKYKGQYSNVRGCRVTA